MLREGSEGKAEGCREGRKGPSGSKGRPAAPASGHSPALLGLPAALLRLKKGIVGAQRPSRLSGHRGRDDVARVPQGCWWRPSFHSLGH